MTPLVLIPGMMCDARLFAPQLACFAQTTVQIPCFGPYQTMADIAAQILQDAPPQFALGGLSMGGIVAMEIVRQAPQRVTRLALLDTNPLAEIPERQQAREPQIERVLAGDLFTVMRDELKPNYLTDGPNKAGLLELCMDMAMGLGETAFVNQSRALQSRPDQTQTLRQIRVPTLVLCGAMDALCPPERHELMHRLIPDASLCIVPRAGHMPTLEQPEFTNQALHRWFWD